MMQSVTRRKRLSYTRRWCIVVATLFTSVHLQREYHEHHGCARTILFLKALSPRETAALSSGLIPAVQATSSLSLHLLPADLRTFRCDRHARRNVEKPSSICTPLALLRLVNILHAVGAGRVLWKGPVGPRPPRCATLPRLPSNASRWERGCNTRRRKSDSVQYRIERTSGYTFSRP